MMSENLKIENCTCKKKKKKAVPVTPTKSPKIEKYIRSIANDMITKTVCQSSTRWKFVDRVGEERQVILTAAKTTLPMKCLHVFNHVKSNAREIEDDFGTQRKVPSIHLINEKDEYLWNGWEIDIRSAYWRSAYKKGLCSPEIFQRFCSKERGYKQARNCAIGDLYSTRWNFLISPENDWRPDIELDEREPVAPKCYWAVRNEVSNLLHAMSRDCKNPIYYWVDQLYVAGSINKRRIEMLAKEWGYEVKFKEVGIFRKRGSFLVNYGDKVTHFPLSSYE